MESRCQTLCAWRPSADPYSHIPTYGSAAVPEVKRRTLHCARGAVRLVSSSWGNFECEV